MRNELIGQLLGFVMAQSALIGDALEPGELMVPYVIAEKDGQREALHFEAETQKLAVKNVEAKLLELTDTFDAWAYSQDGFLRSGDETKQDVFFFKLWAKGMNEPLEAYQMYQPRPFKLLGNIQILNFEETGMNIEKKDEFVEALNAGISSHQAAALKWDAWFE